MRSITLYLHVHQPWRVRRYSIFDVGAGGPDYWSEPDKYAKCNNEFILRKVAEKSFRPMNKLLLRLMDRHPEFKFSLSIPGTLLDQLALWAPDVIKDFQALSATGRMEIVSETYYHSLAFFYDREEFEAQVKLHRDKIKEVFGVKPMVFRNTELAYNDEIGIWASDFGFKGVLAEGWDGVLDWRSPGYVYSVPGCEGTGLLLKNYRLSDDIAFRFPDRGWKEWPLTAEKYLKWMEDAFIDCPLVNLFMDYETFGENIWADTGIFSFFEKFVELWLGGYENRFVTVSEALEENKPVAPLSMPDTVSWADTERDLTAWLGNKMQQEAMRTAYELKDSVLQTADQQLIEDWRRLQTSDHPYYMCTKWFSDGDVHAYFSPYDSPYDAFLYYMNALRDLRYRAEHR